MDLNKYNIYDELFYRILVKAVVYYITVLPVTLMVTPHLHHHQISCISKHM